VNWNIEGCIWYVCSDHLMRNIDFFYILYGWIQGHLNFSHFSYSWFFMWLLQVLEKTRWCTRRCVRHGGLTPTTLQGHLHGWTAHFQVLPHPLSSPMDDLILDGFMHWILELHDGNYSLPLTRSAYILE
jgi:hypothetical protein